MFIRTYRRAKSLKRSYAFVVLSMLVIYGTPVIAQREQDSTRTIRLQEFVITASRLKEEISRSPVTIEKVTAGEILQFAAPTFFDGLEHTKGVQMITPSLGFRVINTRGFTNTTNVRFAQLVDGMDNQAPHIGAPIANALGPNDLDIESVEILPGVASALYGMNAINGLANFVTKDPFEHTGLSIQQKFGFNRAGRQEGAKPFSETSFRWAYKLNPKFAFKVNGTYLRGTDWIANDMTDLNPNANVTTGLTGADNPAYDPVNAYGNESPNRRTLSLNGKNYVVARTGYEEQEVVDYGIQNLKGDISLSYAPATINDLPILTGLPTLIMCISVRIVSGSIITSFRNMVLRFKRKQFRQRHISIWRIPVNRIMPVRWRRTLTGVLNPMINGSQTILPILRMP